MCIDKESQLDFFRQKKGVDKPNALCYNILALKECTLYRGVEQLEARRAHNPEVVGSSPASATIKNTGFRKKSGVFLTFENKMKMPEMGLELVLELVAENAKIENRENPTF